MDSDERRRKQLRYLLDHWDDIFDVSPSVESIAITSGAPGSRQPGRLLKMATEPTIKELVRCLGLLASACPGDYRHLKMFRCGVEWRCVDTWRRVKLPSGKYDWVPDRIRERIVPDWIRPERVAAGEDFILRIFRGEIYIPDPLYGAFVEPEHEVLS